MDNKKTGQIGEEAAVGFLEKNGYQILEKNFRTKLGEIDIIAKEKDTVCFIEVKFRQEAFLDSPLDAITPFKRRKLSQVALMFLKQHNLLEVSARFDVVSIETDNQGHSDIHLLKDAFELVSSYRY